MALLVVAVLASTAPAISKWLGDIIGPSEVDSEYAKAESRLALPSGYAWPKLNFPAGLGNESSRRRRFRGDGRRGNP